MTKNFSCFACISTKLMVAKFPSKENYGFLILESSPDPFYYSRAGFPENLKSVSDHHLYLIVKKPIPCFQDRVMRQNFIIKEKLGINLHVAPGQIGFQGKTYSCIRIRTEDTSKLKVFIEEFRKMGIHFLSDHHVSPYEAFIQFKRYTDFVSLEPGIYKDGTNPNRYFLTISGDMEYKVFEELIHEVKNNCDFHMFDAALVYLNCGSRFIEMISIYSKHCEEERLPELKKTVEELLKQL
jgi:hypothetical protein